MHTSLRPRRTASATFARRLRASLLNASSQYHDPRADSYLWHDADSLNARRRIAAYSQLGLSNRRASLRLCRDMSATTPSVRQFHASPPRAFACECQRSASTSTHCTVTSLGFSNAQLCPNITPRTARVRMLTRLPGAKEALAARNIRPHVFFGPGVAVRRAWLASARSRCPLGQYQFTTSPKTPEKPMDHGLHRALQAEMETLAACRIRPYPSTSSAAHYPYISNSNTHPFHTPSRLASSSPTKKYSIPFHPCAAHTTLPPPGRLRRFFQLMEEVHVSTLHAPFRQYSARRPRNRGSISFTHSLKAQGLTPKSSYASRGVPTSRRISVLCFLRWEVGCPFFKKLRTAFSLFMSASESER
jgi:hypothetical protein